MLLKLNNDATFDKAVFVFKQVRVQKQDKNVCKTDHGINETIY